jgi:hypothetical protein
VSALDRLAFHRNGCGDAHIRFTSDETLAWYDSSDWARRGFCSRCGSSLFYRMKQEGAKWAVLAGTLDLPPGHEIRMEIFVDEKPDYYDLAGDRPRLTAEETLARFGGPSNDRYDPEIPS